MLDARALGPAPDSAPIARSSLERPSRPLAAQEAPQDEGGCCDKRSELPAIGLAFDKQAPMSRSQVEASARSAVRGLTRAND